MPAATFLAYVAINAEPPNRQSEDPEERRKSLLARSFILWQADAPLIMTALNLGLSHRRKRFSRSLLALLSAWIWKKTSFWNLDNMGIFKPLFGYERIVDLE